MRMIAQAGLGAVLVFVSLSPGAQARMLLTDQFFCEGQTEPWQLAIDNRSAVLRHAKDAEGVSREERFEGAHFPAGSDDAGGSFWRGAIESDPASVIVAVIEPMPCVAAGAPENARPDPFRVLVSLGEGQPSEGCCVARSILPMQAEQTSLPGPGNGLDAWHRSVRNFLPAVLACALETRSPLQAVTSIEPHYSGHLRIHYVDQANRPRICTASPDGSEIVEDIQSIESMSDEAGAGEAVFVLAAADGSIPLAARDGRPVQSAPDHTVGWLVDESHQLFDDSGKAALSGDWRIVFSDGGSAGEIPDFELRMAAGNRVEGRAGCFGFSGRYRTAGEFISIGPLLTRRLECEEASDRVAERRLVMGLISAERFAIDGDRLKLSDPGGNLKMELARPD